MPDGPAVNPSSPSPERAVVAVAVRTAAAYGRRILDGILDRAERHRQWEFIPYREPTWAEMLDPRQVDGVIAEFRRREDIAAAKGWRVPAVAVAGVNHPGSVPAVIADNVAVGRAAAQYFLDLGFTEMGYFGTRPTMYRNQRLEGLRLVAEAAGATVYEYDVAEWRHLPGEALHHWLGHLPKPVGVFAVEDASAVAVANACRDLDLAVPEQVAILGVDNDEHLCRMATPPLSSIDHGARRIGLEAAALLERMLAGAPAPTEPLLVEQVQIVTRQSTDTLAIRDPRVAAAVRFIRERACEGAEVADVLRAVSGARRTLEAAFRKTLGRSILQELTRVRVERAKTLLAQTDLAMPEICESAGVSYPSRLTFLIKRATGLTPSQYRASRQG